MKKRVWNFWRLSLLSTFLLILDQILKGAVQGLYARGQGKIFIPPFLFLRHEQDQKVFFVFERNFESWFLFTLAYGLPLIVGVGTLVWLVRNWDKKASHLSSAFFFTGVMGNWIDFVLLGYSVNVFEIRFLEDGLVNFNLSDLCLGGAACLWVRERF